MVYSKLLVIKKVMFEYILNLLFLIGWVRPYTRLFLMKKNNAFSMIFNNNFFLICKLVRKPQFTFPLNLNKLSNTQNSNNESKH
jgi:hypothetical protein